MYMSYVWWVCHIDSFASICFMIYECMYLCHMYNEFVMYAMCHVCDLYVKYTSYMFVTCFICMSCTSHIGVKCIWHWYMKGSENECMHVELGSTSIYLYRYIYIRTYIHRYLYIYIYKYIDIYRYIHMYIYIYVYIYKYIHKYLYIHIHIHIYTYICIYITANPPHVFPYSCVGRVLATRRRRIARPSFE